jgi:hypothetical protein
LFRGIPELSDLVEMKGNRKRLMDTLKILARNLFYTMLAPFKSAYDNYRDDHVIFRSLTTSGGLIGADETQVTCHLMLEPDYPPAIRRLLEEYLKDWNGKSHRFPDGSGRPITLKLITAKGIQVALPNPPSSPNNWVLFLVKSQLPSRKESRPSDFPTK